MGVFRWVSRRGGKRTECRSLKPSSPIPASPAPQITQTDTMSTPVNHLVLQDLNESVTNLRSQQQQEGIIDEGKPQTTTEARGSQGVKLSAVSNGMAKSVLPSPLTNPLTEAGYSCHAVYEAHRYGRHQVHWRRSTTVSPRPGIFC